MIADVPLVYHGGGTTELTVRMRLAVSCCRLVIRPQEPPQPQFCSFIIFHPSLLKDESFFVPLLHHHQFSSSLTDQWVSKVWAFPETAVCPGLDFKILLPNQESEKIYLTITFVNYLCTIILKNQHVHIPVLFQWRTETEASLIWQKNNTE